MYTFHMINRSTMASSAHRKYDTTLLMIKPDQIFLQRRDTMGEVNPDAFVHLLRSGTVCSQKV